MLPLPVNNATGSALMGFAIAAHICVAIVIYQFASQSGLSGPFWAILYLFTCPIGLALFLFAMRTSSFSVSSAAPPKHRRITSTRSMERDPGYMGYRDMRMALPAPSDDFRDRNLEDLVFDKNWEEAMKHVNEMLDLSLEDRDLRREEDYRKISMWIEIKRDPFKSARDRK